MKVRFVNRGDTHLVSTRLRVQAPCEYLQSKGIDASFGDFEEADVHVFSKHFHPEDYFALKSSPCPIFDLCDDHFHLPEIGDYYRKMITEAKAVIVSSEGLREIVQRETGKDSFVIPEEVEFPECEPHQPHYPPKALWHGHKRNLYPLMDCLPKLPSRCLGGLRVVTNTRVGVKPPIEFRYWRLEDMPAHYRWSDIVIIPQELSWKSPNKLAESVRAGRFVVASDIPAYRGFGMYLGDIGEGIQWLKHRDVRPLIRAAQLKVQAQFSPEVIRRKWFDSISAAVRSVGRGGLTATLRLAM